MNFVIFESDSSMYKIVMSDIEKMDNVKLIYRDIPFRSKFLNKLFKVHMSQTINRIFPLPFKNIWYKKLIDIDFKKDEDLCFLFIPGWYSCGFVNWLKKKYPKAKFVLFYRDTVGVYQKVIPSLKSSKIDDQFDLILCYNPEDSKKYGYQYTHAFVSKINKNNLPVFPKSDISFIGVAKDRLRFLIQIYERLESFNLNPNFVIVNVKKEDRVIKEGIKYLDKGISYLDYLGIESASNCILEIIKGDTKGNTYRCWEAVYFNKKLISNWPGIKSFQYYDPRYMLYIENADDINESFFLEDTDVDYGYKNENSPIYLLDLISEKLKSN